MHIARFIERDRNLRHGTDGSARAAVRRARRPGALRTSPPPRACTRNKLDRSGRPTGAAERPSSCRTLGGRSQSAALREYSPDFARQILDGHVQNAAPRIEHHRPSWCQPPQVEPHRFAHPPLQAVSNHALAQRLRRRQTHPGPPLSFDPQTEGGEVRAGDSQPLLVYLPEIGGPQEPGLLGKRQVSAGGFDRLTSSRNEQFSRS